MTEDTRLKPITWEMVGAGVFLYHCAAVDALPSIKKIGLVVPKVHGRVTAYSNPFYNPKIRNRLYVYVTVSGGLDWAMKYKQVTLRFRAELLRDKIPYEDQALRHYGSIFFRNVSVPAKELESCQGAKITYARHSLYVPSLPWRPLSRTDGATVMMD